MRQHVDAGLAVNVDPRTTQICATDHAIAAEIAGLPLHTELTGIVLADFDNQAFDHHLRAALVEQIDHLAQVAIQRLRRGNQQGVGGCVSLNGHAAGTEGDVLLAALRAAATGCAATATLRVTAARAAAAVSGRRAAAALRTALAALPSIAASASTHRAEHRPRTVTGAAVALAREQTTQRLRQFRCLRVTQINHMQIARIALRVIQFIDQIARQLRALWATSANDDGVGTRITNHGDFLRRIIARRIEQIRHHRRDVSGDAVLNLHHIGVDRTRRINARDQLRNAGQVLRVIGDDDGVIARIGVDRIVRRHNRPQHRNQVHRVLVLQTKRAREHAVTRRFVGTVNRPAKQFGISLRHHLRHTANIHHTKPLHAQRRQQHVVSLPRRHLTFRDQGQRALHPRVDQKLLPGRPRQRPHHRLNIRVDKIQRHRLITQRIARQGNARRRRATARTLRDVVQWLRRRSRLGLCAFAVEHRVAAALSIGQRPAEFTVDQQRRLILWCGAGVAACAQCQQQKRRGRTYIIGT
ncbi:hypothetical protein PS941_04840 [Pseudomonas fluorescens]|uniref:Uncharacterized protein n=1 Tax=Pseudomonas fluorescens TaxID=294 RepID=A0A5E7VFE2_PSEFL|nr:hypothetical protein PS941_04840 [Pseudomonas fluorescens]